jgi:hypothetical protein
MSVLQRFYGAMARRDWAGMGACYHDHARFSDPVFPDLDAHGVRAMWKMLLTGGTDLQVKCNVLEEDEGKGRVRLDAHYTFTGTGRRVHNVILSTFQLKDGLILDQRDEFDLWRWSRQALGWKGLLLGWTTMLQGRVRGMAAKRLAKAMAA